MKNYGDHGVDNWELEWIGFFTFPRMEAKHFAYSTLKFVNNKTAPLILDNS